MLSPCPAPSPHKICRSTEIHLITSADHALELRLGLRGDSLAKPRQEKKRLFWEITEKGSKNDDLQAKSQVAGWPPVCSYRKRATPSNEKEADPSKTFVKVSMDGAVYLRKIEPGAQGGYRELVTAIQKLFSRTGVGLAEDADEDVWLEYTLIYQETRMEIGCLSEMSPGRCSWDRARD
ncbi:hypothetical protein MLD38_029434 [Melastoma candidum]|uniref:Uncharacterized protein n=1 Tax=Melastoma candidum TaxID=119954 RepID=A0ACB9N3Z1_9MYRT|nr:hypothetical protein MLD38_029434 [Melastoma candidum]